MSATGVRFAAGFGMSRARRHAADALISVSSLCAVIGGLSLVSADVRTQIANAIAGGTSGQLSAMAFRTQAFGHALVSAANDYHLTNAPLLGFGIIAIVLFFLMFRA